MGRDARGRDALAEVRAMIQAAELERARLLRAGHPRGDPSDPACPLGSLDLWLTALRRRRGRLLRGDDESR